MITTLYHFAKLLEDNADVEMYFSPAENPFDGREGKGKVLVGRIENKKFEGFEVEDFKKAFIPKYLYRRPAGSNGTNTVPTLYVNISSPDKTSKKIRQSIENFGLDFTSKEDLEKALSEFENFNFDKAFSYIITFTIDSKYFGQFDEYKKTFEEEAYKKYFKKSYGTSKANEKLCAVTGEKTKIYGFVDVLGFTVKSDAFRRNGFDANNSYKMFPVSKKTIPYLEAAQSILINQIATGFFGKIQYAIVPHFIFQPELSTAKYIARKFLTKAALNIDGKEDSGAYGFINDQESILKEIIKDGDLNKNDIYYTILFFEEAQAQFKIHLELNDVLPSRISKILDAKEKAEKTYRKYTSYQTKKGEIKQQRITLYWLREYFRTGEKELQPAFFKLVQSIFTGQAYDDSKLTSLILKAWKKSYKENFYEKENTFNFLVKNTLGNLYFLNLLQIFKPQYNMNVQTETKERQDAFIFIEAHPAYFQKEYVKGAFIFGCLTSRLLYNQPGNAFMKELNGLNINQDIVKKKFPKLIAKLRQYEKEFPNLEAAAMRCFSSGEKANKDEISFAFTMGLVLQKDFDKINKINKPQKAKENE